MALATIATVATVVGTGISAYGTYESMQQQADMTDYNAALADAEAKQVQAETREKATRARRENDRFKSKQRAAFAKSGITSTGTPLEVMSQTAADLELGVLDLAYQGETKRRALLNKASINKYQAGSLKDAAPIATAGVLLGGATSIARMKL